MMFQRGGSMNSPTDNRKIFNCSTSRRLPGQFFYLLEQRIKVFSLEKAITAHRMAHGLDLACVLPVAKGIRGNAQIFSGIGYSEVFPQLLHVRPPWRGDPRISRPYQLCQSSLYLTTASTANGMEPG